MENLILLASPFILNSVVGGVKWFFGSNLFSTAGKRGILAIVAVLGSVSFSLVTDAPIDMDSISSLWGIAVDSFVAFLLAHGSYHLFWKK